MKRSGRKKLRRVDAIDARGRRSSSTSENWSRRSEAASEEGAGQERTGWCPKLIAIVSGILLLNKF